MTPLEAEIRAMITLDGPMPVARYMALCLGHPIHGYYVTRDPLGVGGDFVTAPEISQMFGEMIGLWAAAVWQQMGEPPRLNLIELGPGRGTLMADALRAAAVLPAFSAALSVHLVETSPPLRIRQQTALEGVAQPVAWHRHLSEAPAGPAVIVANEFFDALPVHQGVKGETSWHERLVGMGENAKLVFAAHAHPLLHIEKLLPPGAEAAPLGTIFEWRSGDIVEEIATRVMTHGGAALVIDYGHAERALGDTLQAVRGHAYADPLEAPGEADLTAHVDFAALSASARAAGAAVFGPVRQGDFLKRLGIEVRAATLKRAADARQQADIDAALTRLTEGGTGMGQLFKALAIVEPRLGAVPGFEG